LLCCLFLSLLLLSFLVDDELKGAEALAYRLDLDVYGTKCGYFSNVENCRPATACVVDMYIDDLACPPLFYLVGCSGCYSCLS
jgi:hypothetical protein